MKTINEIKAEIKETINRYYGGTFPWDATAIIVETTLPGDTEPSAMGWRFEERHVSRCAVDVGWMLYNSDHSTSKVLAIVAH